MSEYELTQRQEETYNLLPASKYEIAEEFNISPSTAKDRIASLRNKGLSIDYDSQEEKYIPSNQQTLDKEEEFIQSLENVEQSNEPNINNLTSREKYITGELETGATIEELSEELGIRPSVVKANLREIHKEGWKIYHDDTANRIAIESDHPLRSSEHKGTRTRKANKWWELNHNELVREFRELEIPDSNLESTNGKEDWVVHMTDIHAGDIVRSEDGSVIYETDMVPDIIDYVTEQSIRLAEKHNSDYDSVHLLWGGDMVTNEGIYEGQFEDLDAWLDEQHDTLIEPLIKQVKKFSKKFKNVQIVCQVGNHGKNRASGTSGQANADLILYKTIRNTISQIEKHSDLLDNVKILVGEAKPYRNFEMRGGEIKGHLRHGQHRKPQAETSARQNQWRGTLIEHEFDISYMGHYHISGRIPWDGPPVIVSPSPKPADEYVEKISGRVSGGFQNVATVHGVSDDGITCVFPVDMRNYER